MQEALERCKEIKSEIDSTSRYVTFGNKVEALAKFADDDLETVIEELEEGIDANDNLLSELKEAKNTIEELEYENDRLKSRIEELERESDATV